MESKRINWLGDFGLFMIRVMLGVVFVYHGGQKLFGLFDGASLGGFARYLDSLNVPYAAGAAVLAGGAEFLGGLALITGYGMRLMIVPLATTMGAACYLVHRDAFSIQHNGLEYPLTLGVVLLGLAMIGPGRLCLQNLFPGKISLPDTSDADGKRTTDKEKKSKTKATNTATTQSTSAVVRKDPPMASPSRDTRKTEEPTTPDAAALERVLSDRIASLTRPESRSSESAPRTDSTIRMDTPARSMSAALADSIIRPREPSE